MFQPQFFPRLSRRDALKSIAGGFGYLALTSLMAESARAEATANPLAAKPPQFPARAKRVIFMFNQGGPSHVDTFDYKPGLATHDGEPPGEVGIYKKGGDRKLMQSPFKFSQHGKSGLWLSELFPNLARQADDLCLLNSMHTDLPNHPQASVQMHTGSFQFVRPSLGAWVLYGLGTNNSELPGFITLNPLSGIGGAQNYASAFLPAPYQGTRIGDGGGQGKAAIPNLHNGQMSLERQRMQLDYLQDLNRRQLETDKVNNDLEGVIESYELAFRMQGAVPRLMDLGNETKATLDAYGIDEKNTDSFGRQCLLARRFAEAGVRFIELSTNGWDQHRSLRSALTRNCQGIDKPIAALIADLKQRGLLDDTLIVWGGEFGRTPHVKDTDGRDHNSTGFSMWMAGGGVKGGMRYGATDEFGIAAVDDKMHVHDLHATILHLLGLDHERLTYRYSGRDFRLTDVHGHVAKKIIA